MSRRSSRRLRRTVVCWDMFGACYSQGWTQARAYSPWRFVEGRPFDRECDGSVGCVFEGRDDFDVEGSDLLRQEHLAGEMTAHLARIARGPFRRWTGKRLASAP